MIPGSGRSPGKGIGYPLQYSWGSLVVQSVAPAYTGDLGSISGLGRSSAEGMATHSSSLAWRCPVNRGAWWATVMGSPRARHD